MTTSFVDLAKEVIADLAAETDAETSITFTQTSYTRTNPWEAPTASTPTTQTITGFVFGPGTRRYNGEIVPDEERVMYVAAADVTDVTLGVDTKATIGTKKFATDRFNRIPEGDSPALYEIFIGAG